MSAGLRDVRTQARLLLVLMRPALVFLLLSFALLGLAVGGHAQDLSLAAPVAVAVVGFLLVAVAVNDIADHAVDQINLPGRASRPLASGTATSRDMACTAAVSGVAALSAAAWLGWPVVVVVCAGLLLAVTYSLKPFSLSKRGAAASLILPFGYVAVPFLTATLAAHALRPSSWTLLGGLYVGFIGRIVLKDFRDVVGDTLLGKRTFLVRHGRAVTCRVSAVFWLLGSTSALFVTHRSISLDVAYLLQVAAVLLLLRELSRSSNPRHDEAFISAIAILGRGCVMVLIGHYAMLGRAPLLTTGFVLGLSVMSLVAAWSMVTNGPAGRLYLPAWVEASVESKRWAQWSLQK